MGFLILMLGVIFLLRFILPGPEIGYTGRNEKPWCPPHQWEYNKDGFLQCTICSGKPGYEGRE